MAANPARSNSDPRASHDYHRQIAAEDYLASVFRKNQHTSPLLRLPAELRTKIFEHVFAVPIIRIGDKALVKPRFKYSKSQLSLLGVCRQIYHEARTLPFSVNSFRGWSGKVDASIFDYMQEWQMASITDIRLYVEKMDVYRDPDIKLRDWFVMELQALCILHRLKHLTLMWYEHKFVSVAEGLFKQTWEILKEKGRTDITIMVLDCDPCKEFTVGPDKTELEWDHKIECTSELVLM